MDDCPPLTPYPKNLPEYKADCIEHWHQNRFYLQHPWSALDSFQSRQWEDGNHWLPVSPEDYNSSVIPCRAFSGTLLVRTLQEKSMISTHSAICQYTVTCNRVSIIPRDTARTFKIGNDQGTTYTASVYNMQIGWKCYGTANIDEWDGMQNDGEINLPLIKLTAKTIHILNSPAPIVQGWHKEIFS